MSAEIADGDGQSGDCRVTPPPPDGKTIAFTSDRSGTQRLHTMSSIDGSGVTLIAPGVQNATFPDWSPIGNP